jgi:cobalamin biosynthesis Mg chelatase CobN
MFFRTLVTGVVVLGAMPGLAHAATSVAPPGNSAVDQYRESVPSTPASPGAPGGSPGGSGTVPKSTRRALEGQGRAGRDLASVLAKTGGVATPRAEGVPAEGGAARVGSGRTSGAPSSSSGKSATAATSGSASAPTEGQSAAVGTSARTAGESGSAAEEGAASPTQAAATSTVGPFPVWMMVVGAFVVVGVGLVLRRRPAA